MRLHHPQDDTQQASLSHTHTHTTIHTHRLTQHMMYFITLPGLTFQRRTKLNFTKLVFLPTSSFSSHHPRGHDGTVSPLFATHHNFHSLPFAVPNEIVPTWKKASKARRLSDDESCFIALCDITPEPQVSSQGS